LGGRPTPAQRLWRWLVLIRAYAVLAAAAVVVLLMVAACSAPQLGAVPRPTPMPPPPVPAAPVGG
jgi:hypothetical protein